MKHIKNARIFKTKVYCPAEGVERKFSFDPEDFCPICRNRISWGDPK